MARLPPLESLRVFEACARHGNFTRAADELGVTPAAVSLRVRDLEAELGVRLFGRSGPRVFLTAEGARLAARMGAVMREVRSAVEECRGGVPAIRLTAAASVAARWLAPRLPAYRQAQVTLDVSDDLRPAEGFDLWVRSGEGPWAGFEGVELFPVEGSPMLSPALLAGRRLETPHDLLGLPLFGDARWPRWFAAAGAGEVVPPAGAVAYPSQELAAQAVLAGTGVALLSPRLFRALVDDGRLVQPFGETVRGPGAYHLLWRRGEARGHVRAFADWLRAQATAWPPAAGPARTGP